MNEKIDQYLCKWIFNRIQVRTVRRKIHDLRPHRLNRFLHAGDLMRTQIVQHYNIAFTKCRQIACSINNGKIEHRTLWGAAQDELLAMDDCWALRDHLNTVRKVVDAKGCIVSIWSIMLSVPW